MEAADPAGLFEICFEQARKTMKEIWEQHEHEESQTGFPKAILIFLPSRPRIGPDDHNHTRQISLAYCRMVRSEENLPAWATFFRHLRAKPSGSAA